MRPDIPNAGKKKGEMLMNRPSVTFSTRMNRVRRARGGGETSIFRFLRTGKKNSAPLYLRTGRKKERKGGDVNVVSYPVIDRGRQNREKEDRIYRS